MRCVSNEEVSSRKRKKTKEIIRKEKKENDLVDKKEKLVHWVSVGCVFYSYWWRNACRCWLSSEICRSCKFRKNWKIKFSLWLKMVDREFAVIKSRLRSWNLKILENKSIEALHKSKLILRQKTENQSWRPLNSKHFLTHEVQESSVRFKSHNFVPTRLLQLPPSTDSQFQNLFIE